MKHLLSLIIAAAALLILCAPGVYAAPDKPAVSAREEFRAMWVASVINLDYPSKPGVSVEVMKSEAVSTLDNALKWGMNAVILQVRPTGDAYYKSDIFPWSNYLTGEQGKAPVGGFDPLTFWVDEAHKRGLELHAWVNPFRITKGSASAPKQDVNTLAQSNPARKNPAWTVKYTDGCLYYDPGIPEVRQLIVNGVAEIVRNYAVDGIHYDDYFYPNPDFPDSTSFSKYGSGYAQKDNWRRDNINDLIQKTYDTVKSIRPDCRFGVSPFAVWANKKNNAFGSDTNGYESYYSQFADTRKWVKSGWVDYIAPQIYWQIGYATADYAKVLSWWADTVAGTSVDLYIGHATYRLDTGKTAADAWYGTQEIVRQTELNRKTPQVKGSIHFRYSFLRDNAKISAAVAALYGETIATPAPSASQSPAPSGTTGAEKLTIGRPERNITTDKKNYYMLGASDPTKPLTMNGEELKDRTASGFFGVYVELKSGANVFTFKQGDEVVVRTLTRADSGGSSPTKMSKAEITSGSAFPVTYDEYRMPGETVTLKCTAPIGATVTVRLAGETYTMKPAATSKPSGSGIYATTFSYEYKLPGYTSAGKVLTVGTPTYTMKYNGVTSTRTAAAAIKCLTKDAPYYATVAVDSAFVYPKASTSGGPEGELARGQKDIVTAVADGWVRLGMGLWVQRGDVTRTLEDNLLSAAMTNAAYSAGDRWDTFTLTGAPVAGRVTYDGKALVWTLNNTKSGARPALPQNAPFENINAVQSGGKTTYTLTLKQGETLDGYYMSCTADTVTLNIKRRLQLTPANAAKPLQGLTIVLDAGHGGSESGAIGPAGAAIPEKTLNLTNALKLKPILENLGASVVMSRTTDAEVSLNERVVLNRKTRPDLFLSLHTNSLDEATNSSTVRGVAVFYRDKISADFSQFIYDSVWGGLSMPKRGCNQSNLYVCRPTWCPSVIIESSFICNPQDFEWLVSDAEQNRYVQAIADGIVAYFTK